MQSSKVTKNLKRYSPGKLRSSIDDWPPSTVWDNFSNWIFQSAPTEWNNIERERCVPPSNHDKIFQFFQVNSSTLFSILRIKIAKHIRYCRAKRWVGARWGVCHEHYVQYGETSVEHSLRVRHKLGIAKNRECIGGKSWKWNKTERNGKCKATQAVLVFTFDKNKGKRLERDTAYVEGKSSFLLFFLLSLFYKSRRRSRFTLRGCVAGTDRVHSEPWSLALMSWSWRSIREERERERERERESAENGRSSCIEPNARKRQTWGIGLSRPRRTPASCRSHPLKRRYFGRIQQRERKRKGRYSLWVLPVILWSIFVCLAPQNCTWNTEATPREVKRNIDKERKVVAIFASVRNLLFPIRVLDTTVSAQTNPIQRNSSCSLFLFLALSALTMVACIAALQMYVYRTNVSRIGTSITGMLLLLSASARKPRRSLGHSRIKMNSSEDVYLSCL